MGKKVNKILKFIENPRHRCFFAAIPPCLIALIIYCYASEFPSPFPDSHEYQELSKNLVEHGHFKYSSDTSAGEGSLRRTPGYPVMIAAFRLFAGDHGFFPLNLVFLYGICVLSFKLASKFKIHSWKLLAILLTLSPGMIICTTAPMTEIPFCFWLVAAIYLLTVDSFVLAGLCLSVASIIRPAGILLFIIVLIWMLCNRKKTVHVLLFVAMANLLPVCWSLHNYAKFGYFSYTTLSGYYLLYYKAGSYLSWHDNVPFDTQRKQLGAQLKSTHPIERAREAGNLGRKILLDNFFGFCFWAPRNLVNFFMPDITPLLERIRVTSGGRGTLDILRRQGILAAVKHYFGNNMIAGIITLLYCIFYGLSWLLAPFGIWRIIRCRQYALLCLVGGITAYLWIIPVGNLDWRFRVPAIPLIFIVMSSGFIYLQSRYVIYKQKRRRERHESSC